MNKTLFNSAFATFLAGVSGIALAVPSYDASVGFEDIHECGTGSDSSLIQVGDVTSSGNDATTCFGAYSGNNGDILKWGDHTWSSIAKLEEENSFSTTDFSLEFSNGSELEDSEGSWKYTGDFSNWESFFVVTKASKTPGWAAYFFDDVPNIDNLNGTFSIPWTANNNDSADGPADLSHLSLYAKTAVSVPEPGTLGLLGLGLVGFTLARRKNRAS